MKNSTHKTIEPELRNSQQNQDIDSLSKQFNLQYLNTLS